MFEQNEVIALDIKNKAEYYNNDIRLKRILTRISNYGDLAINLSDFNYILKLRKIDKHYSITKLKELLHSNNIGYSWLIKNLKIPRATLSKILNSERNVKLITLNKMFSIISNNTELKISKQDLLD